MKLSHLSQIRIINISKLIFYHPPLALVAFFEFSSIFNIFGDLQNMIPADPPPQQPQPSNNNNSFWEEIDKIVISPDDKIRTRKAMQLISKVRHISLKSVKFTDSGVKLLQIKQNMN